MNELHFQERTGNIEARDCDKHLIKRDKSTTIEISQWAEDNSYRWTIAYFVRESEGFSLKFVGCRPFDGRGSPVAFMEIAKKAQECLDEYFEQTGNLA